MVQFAVILRCAGRDYVVSIHSGDGAEKHATESADIVAGHPRPTAMRMQYVYGSEPFNWVGVDIVRFENGNPVSVVSHHKFGGR